GLLIYHKTSAAALKQLLWFSHDGKPAGQLGQEADYRNLDISPKGDRAAVDMIKDNNRDIWVIDLERSIPQRVTFDPGEEWSAVWSPDGGRLMFTATRKNTNKIFEKSSTGTGVESVIDVGEASSIPVHWAPDDKHIVYSRLRANGNGYDTWLLPLFGERKPIPYLES